MNRRRFVNTLLLMAIAGPGCIKLHRHTATMPSDDPASMAATEPTSMPSVEPTVPMPMPPQPPTTAPVATSELGDGSLVVGLAPPAKPFFVLPKPIRFGTAAKPSTLLLEHASPDSPVPLSEYAKQPVYGVDDFHLAANLSASTVQALMGPPAQLADAEDPWLVYRLGNDREIWLHFSGRLQDTLDAADVIHGAEDGYVRDRVFPASHLR